MGAHSAVAEPTAFDDEPVTERLWFATPAAGGHERSEWTREVPACLRLEGPRMISRVDVSVPPQYLSDSARRRAPKVVAVAGAVVAVIGLGAHSSGGSTSSASTSTAPSSTTSSTRTSSTAAACGVAVAAAYDATASSIAYSSAYNWSSIVRSHRSQLASAYGSGSAEYRAYDDASADLLDWATDVNAGRSYESYDSLVSRSTTAVMSTCSNGTTT